MLEPTLKIVLASFRPGSEDATDPLFAEALRETERDPALAAWLADEQRFDSIITAKLREVGAPTNLKELILLGAAAPAARPRAAAAARSLWNSGARRWLAVAAAVVLAFFLGRETVPFTRRPGAVQGSTASSLALQAIDYTGRMPALQFVCFDAAAVRQWIDQKSAAMNMGKLIEKPMPDMGMIGSSTAEWGGKPVIMIALQHGGQMGMLYLVRAADFPAAAARADTITEKDGWISRTGRRGAHLYVLTTKGTRKDLDFPMPL